METLSVAFNIFTFSGKWKLKVKIDEFFIESRDYVANISESNQNCLRQIIEMEVLEKNSIFISMCGNL